MLMIDTETKRRWIKRGITAIVVLAALIAASYFVFRLLDSGRLNPIALLIPAAVLFIAIPMVRANFFPTRRDLETEYAFHERRLEKAIEDQVIGTLGREAWLEIFKAPGHYREAAAENLQKLLAREATQNDPHLHSALLLVLARFFEKTGNPEAALPSLTAALEIAPRHFIARMHLAGTYEWIGADEKALEHYQKLLDHPQELSVAMRKLVAAKIKHIRSA